MPITVTAPRGLLTPEGEHQVLPRLTQSLIEVSGLTGNPFFEQMVGGTVHLLDPDDVYAGGRAAPIVMVELKLPGLGLATLEARAAFIERATAVVDELTIDGHEPRATWVNILNAPDGAWGVGGRSWTNDQLLEAIGSAAVA
jgi:phenylpyruvate tautomerase PptA (4-oxalocrotonate tautomerase family)